MQNGHFYKLQQYQNYASYYHLAFFKIAYKVVWYNDCSNYISEAVEYIFKQCIKLSKVETDDASVLINDEIGFYKAVEDMNGKYGQAKISLHISNRQNLRQRRISKHFWMIQKVKKHYNIIVL